MTEADLVEAISGTYGPPSRRIVPSRARTERGGRGADLIVASWEDVEYSVTLSGTADSSAFRLIVASTRLAVLAQAAGAVGVQLDVDDAPQSEVRAGSDVGEDRRSVPEKSRLANKAAFKP